MIESKLTPRTAECFDLVGSRQHGVAAKSKATSTKANCLLNAHSNDHSANTQVTAY